MEGIVILNKLSWKPFFCRPEPKYATAIATIVSLTNIANTKPETV